MKPALKFVVQRCVGAVALLLFPFLQSLQAQQVLETIDNPQSQADYVIICPPAYATTMQEFATHRAAYSHLRVVIVTTDSIYQVFGQGVRPDSAIRDFVTYALTSWADPTPQYFLLGGNVNVVPSHKEEPILPGYEDSIMVDQWLVEGLSPQNIPAAALGRFPAWNETQLQTMVNKTIDYENAPNPAQSARSIAVADYSQDVGNLFEQIAVGHQAALAPLWTDTVTIHVRANSPQYRTRTQFRQLWDQGAAIVSMIGQMTFYRFSRDAYFTTWDIDSLSASPLLSFCILDGDQRFERFDTLAMAVKLLQTESKGAVAVFAPSGAVYVWDYSNFHITLFQQMASHPQESIGKSILAVKVFSQSFQARKYTLLGDPALVIKNPLLADVHGGPAIPNEFALHQNFPNPFNPTTQISFDLPQSGIVSLKVFNLLGEEVGTLVDGSLESGTHAVAFNADAFGLGSGIYFYRLTSRNLVQTKKMVLVK